MINLANVNLQHLYYFHVVASQGSIKVASKELHLTQPAVSMRIRSLEENLEITLFDRKQRELRLTSGGQCLFEYTTQIFSLTQKALSSLAPRTLPKRLLRAGFVPSVSKSFVHDVLKPLWDREVILEVSHGAHSELIA
ncbi:MAG: LysR family transcriptional regulator, partial [Bdellovibrionota bacterium]